MLVSASNETPPPNQGLEALYDRFLVRLDVNPIKSRENFETLLQDDTPDIEVDDNLKIKTKEWEEFKTSIKNVNISKDVFNIIHSIRIKIEEYNQKTKEDIIYISDRRWKKSAYLLKASAYFCGRDETNIADSFILKHCLWSEPSEKEVISKIVKDSIFLMSVDTGISIETLKEKKNSIQEEIKEEIFYQEDVYENVVEKNGEKCFEVKLDIEGDNFKIYIPLSKMGKKEFYPTEIEMFCDDNQEYQSLLKFSKDN